LLTAHLHPSSVIVVGIKRNVSQYSVHIRRLRLPFATSNHRILID
jgi:hypothetical protein